MAGALRDLILRGSIVTNFAKAKSIAPMMEKLITKARLGTEQKRREVFAALTHDDAVRKLWEEASTRFLGRSSGFTRVVKLGMRRGDASEMAKVVFVDAPVVIPQVVTPAKAEKPVKVEVKKESMGREKLSKKTKSKTPRKVAG